MKAYDVEHARHLLSSDADISMANAEPKTIPDYAYFVGQLAAQQQVSAEKSTQDLELLKEDKIKKKKNRRNKKRQKERQKSLQ